MNLFDRLKGGRINLDGRDSTLDTGDPGESQYALTLQLAPAQVQIGQAATVVVRVRKDATGFSQLVTLSGTDDSVGATPASVMTNASGDYIFQVIGATLGTTTISASMVVDGQTYNSNSVTFIVATMEPPIDYGATGYGRVILSVENPLAAAMIPRVQRLSDQEQRRKHPTDTGLSRVASYENLEIEFLPTFLQ